MKQQSSKHKYDIQLKKGWNKLITKEIDGYSILKTGDLSTENSTWILLD
jgi:hypothetical protein